MGRPRPSRSSTRGRSEGARHRASAARWILTGGLLAGIGAAAGLDAGEEAARLGLHVAPGFEVTLFSDHEIANDLYAMAVDARGRVAVTSRGWVKVLEDADGDGRADRASVFAETGTGGMGLCFDGTDLYFTGDGWFSRYRDADADGRADGPPERILPLAFGEHGGHAMRKGPDGWWYLVGGNDAGISEAHASLARSPVRRPRTGAFLRVPPDGKGSEVIAHGFRNPYDFDFNDAGDIFTYDSDCERDFFLPWYTPTRIYHVAHGMHHGWRLTGYLRSFARRADFPDAVDMLWPVGRGSPTGVCAYRHRRFPERYRGGLFALDWTFGKVWFFPLAPDGATYSTRAEVFLEPVGAEGFAPVDIAVAPDGALFIAIGGRRTRGAVYRVDWTGAAPAPRRPAGEIDGVLDAPQPLDAWSRAAWMPLARKLGPGPFAAAAADGARSAAARLRAVEVLTELFGGLPGEVARAAAGAADPLVRARAAWSIGRAPAGGAQDLLPGLAADPDPRVRARALEAIADLGPGPDPAAAARDARGSFDHADGRVRRAAARLAALLPDPAWEALARESMQGTTRDRLTLALAGIERSPGARFHAMPLEAALSVLGMPGRSAGERFDAVRLIVRALGDSNLESPPVEVHADYSLPPSPQLDAALAARILAAVRPVFPSGHARLDEEASRLLAMLEDDDAATAAKAAAFLGAESHPTSDMHYLIVLSRLRAPLDADLARKVAAAVAGLDRKLQGDQARTKQTWGARLSELLGLFARRSPEVVEAVLRHPDFIRPAHVVLAAALEPERRREAARRFLAAATEDERFEWSEGLVGLLGELPADEAHPALRARWDHDHGLRDAILLGLARRPEDADRPRHLAGVESARAEVVRASLGAIEALPPDGSADGLVPLFRLLSRLLLEPREAKLRARVAALIARQAGRAFDAREDATDPPALGAAYRPLFDWLAAAHPAAAASLAGGAEDGGAWRTLLRAAPWDEGDAARGAAVSRARGCETCHAVQGALGPSLAGAASRFSREDLFEAIARPDRDVAPAYRATVFQMKDGRVFTGVVAFESADGYIVQTGATATVRLAEGEIEARWPGKGSLMPSGLLDGLGPRDAADLYAHLRALRP
jgi:putative membrane-bound dehydrogenase-like protein